MERFFLFLFTYFRERRILFFTIIIATILAAAFLAHKLTLEEDISKSLPGDNDEIAGMLRQSRLTNKIILNLFLSDSLKPSDPGKLIAFADELTDSLQNHIYLPYLGTAALKIYDSLIEDVLNSFYENLPIYLTEEDYVKIDSLISPEVIDRSLEKNYKTLVSPSGFAMKKFILEDPLGIKSLAIARLKQFQLEDGYEIIDGYIFTQNKRNLLLFLNPVNPPGETRKNAVFFSRLDKLLDYLSVKNSNSIKAEYFGSAAVAVGNAWQIKRDIATTVSVALIIILLFTGWFFRKVSIPFISFFPAIFGGLIALAILFLLKGKMSTIALGIGSVLLGIIVDYALYIYNLQKAKGSVEQVIRDMSMPVLMCSITSAVAFFSLMFVKSEVLRDLGLFAGLSIIGAALFSLVVLPHFINKDFYPSEKRRSTLVVNIAAYKFENNRFVLLMILILTLIALFFYKRAAFETDMYSMNYMSRKMKESEKNLNKINNISLRSIYVISTGENLSRALKVNGEVAHILEDLKNQNVIKKYSNISSILIDDSVQIERIQKWSDYWPSGKKEELRNLLIKTGQKYGFRKEAFTQFYSFIDRNFQPVDISNFHTVRDLFLNDMITETGDMTIILSLVRAGNEARPRIFAAFTDVKNTVVIDFREITSRFVSGTKKDFDLLVNLCLIFVTAALILAFGRFETGLITAIPMFVSWLWTLGFMGATGIKFNIFNIVVSTFVFGLGVDYAILMMRGLLLEYKYGQKELPYYKTSIFLSAFTTVVGVGALILARHPSLHSIALISVIGLFSVVIISYTLEPILFKWLVYKNGRKRVVPLTIIDILSTVIYLSVGLLFCILLNILFFLVFPLPIRSKVKRKILHQGVFWSLKISALGLISIKRKTINEGGEDFTKPSVIIANHQSHIDLPLVLMLSPKIIILTNKWVWNNPLYALVIRYLGFYSVTKGFEPLIDKLRIKVEEGYSIMVFPEGTRSSDSTIKRFHKGAFLLAEKLNLDITPLMIHGAGDCMNKGENHLRSGRVTVKIFPRIRANDKSFGNDYHERTKSALRFFRTEYKVMKSDLETPAYFRRKLIRNFIYKGPVLEWYIRIKLALEDNYEIINKNVPRDAKIVDIGCGYGLISYMLNFTSDSREILGIDYDNDKVRFANTCISKNDRINFVAADALLYNYPMADVFLLSDVLHYMTEELQEQLLTSCIKNLRPGGIIIIRDADSGLEKRHLVTRYTEFFSTRFGWNKSVNRRLSFFSASQIEVLATKNNMKVEIADNSKFTSNLLFILRAVK